VDFVLFKIAILKKEIKMKKSTIFSLVASFLLGLTTEAQGTYVADIEYLYWQASQSGMTYGIAIESESILDNPTELHQSFDWGSGFRIGVGYNLPCSNYETRFSWTRFHNNVTTSTSSPVIIGTEVAGIFDFIVGGDAVGGGPAISSWNLSFDMLDWDFGINLCLSDGFNIYPYIGIKGGWIDQSQNISYVNFLFADSETAINALVIEKNNFSGIGPKTGFTSSYALGKGFSIAQEFSFAFLYGSFNTPTDTTVDAIDGEEIFTTTFINAVDKLVPATQLLLGMNWSTCYCNSVISLGVAYEFQYFWNTWRNQNSFIQNIYVTDAGYDDLTLQGITARLQIEF